MTRMEEISGKLSGLNTKITKVRVNLEAAIQREKEKEQEYERAVHRCFSGEIPQEQEDAARAAWDTAKVEIDRLRRILPMLEAQRGPLEKELKGEEWAAALETAQEAEQKLKELAEQVCDKYEEASTIGIQMERVREDSAHAMQVLGRAKIPTVSVSQEAWKKRQARQSRPLYVFPFGSS